MRIHFFFILLITATLMACGGPRPTGPLKECLGSTLVQEEGTESISIAVAADYRFGQFVSLPAGTTIAGLMIKAVAAGVTGVKIYIYTGGQIGYDPSAPPLIEYTITRNINSPTYQEIWLDLPEAYVLPELLSGGTNSEYYFISFEPIGGTLTPKVGFGNTNTGLRRGSRVGSKTQWTLSDSGMAFNMGYKTPSDCQ